MRRFAEKWYMSLFIIPIILTYLTTYIDLPKIFDNWTTAIILSLIILVMILTYELISAKGAVKSFQPKESDKNIVKHLLSELDLDSFQEDIYQQHAWYGYKKEAIGKTISFVYEVGLIKNKVTDKDLQKLINNFSNRLKEFHTYSSARLFGDTDHFFVPDKSQVEEKREEIQNEAKEMNRLAAVSFTELEKLIDYLKTNDYI